MKKLISILSVFMLLAISVVGCTATDPITGDLYTENIFPSDNVTFDLGSPALTWDEGYFDVLYIGGDSISTPAYGELYVSVPAATTCTLAGTYYLVAGATTADELRNFTHNGSGRLTHTGTETGTFIVSSAISVSSDVNNVILSTKIYKNGAAHEPSLIKRKIAVAGDIGALALISIMELETNDYVEIYIATDKPIVEITFGGMTLTASTIEHFAVGGGGGTGDVVGPAGATDHNVARYDGVTGKLIQDSVVTIDDLGNITTANDLDAFDINAGNDLNCVNDLDVTDDADVGGNLAVVGTINTLNLPADVVLDADFDATTFLYALLDDTPVANTPAQVLVILSGEAGVAFDWNAQNLTNIGNITAANVITAGNVDGRDVSVDGAKLDLIEALADVTDAVNVDGAGATMNTDFNAKGDLLTATGDDTPVILPVGADTHVLTANSGVANGIEWAAPAGGGGVSYTELSGTVMTVSNTWGVADGVWYNWDLSGTLPVGTETAEIHILKNVATDSVGVRADGSALAREQDILKAQVMTFLVEVESTRIIEIQSDDVSDADVFSLWGYWD